MIVIITVLTLLYIDDLIFDNTDGEDSDDQFIESALPGEY